MMQNVLTQAVTFRGQMSDFLSSAMKTSIFPEVDPEKVGDAVRRMEQRVADRFDELATRVGKLEGGSKARGKAKRAAKPAKAGKAKSKSARGGRAKASAKRRR